MLCRWFSFSLFCPLEFTNHGFRFLNVFRLRCLPAANQQNVNGRAGSRVIDPISPTWIRISETPSPTDSQSPKFPKVALRRRARILALAFWSARLDSQASKSDDRTKVFTFCWCIRVDTVRQAYSGGSARVGKPFTTEAQSRRDERRRRTRACPPHMG